LGRGDHAVYQLAQLGGENFFQPFGSGGKIVELSQVITGVSGGIDSPEDVR